MQDEEFKCVFCDRVIMAKSKGAQKPKYCTDACRKLDSIKKSNEKWLVSKKKTSFSEKKNKHPWLTGDLGI